MTRAGTMVRVGSQKVKTCQVCKMSKHSSFTLSPSYPFFQYRPIPLGDTLQARIRYTDAQGDKHEQKFICRTF